MALTQAAPNNVIAASLYNEIVNLLNGTALAGQPVLLTQLSSASAWGLTIKNVGLGGQAVRVQSAAGADLLTVSDTGTTLVGGAISGVTTVAVTVTPASGTSAGWKILSTGSAISGTGATGEGYRTALVSIRDTNEASLLSCALLVDVIEDVAGTVVTRTGGHFKIWTRLDRGESSAILGVQSGGGGGATIYHSHRMRPTGKPNLAYSPQGALEVATSDMSFGAMFQSGFAATTGYTEATLTGNMTDVQNTVPVSDLSLFPSPGGAVPYTTLSSLTNWPAILYAEIVSHTTGLVTETISFTANGAGTGAGNLTGVVRGINGVVATAHTTSDIVRLVCPSNAVWVRLSSQVAKGIVIFPEDGASFDTRPALSIAAPLLGQIADGSARLTIRLSGAIETVGAISTTTTISATTSVSTGQVNAANASVTSGLTVGGQQLLTGVITPTALTANTDNWNPTGLSTARVIRIGSTGGPWNLTGIVAQTAGTVLTLRNVSAVNIVLVYDATSTAANRFLLPSGVNYTLVPQAAVELWYDTASTHWCVLSGGAN